MTIRLAFIGLLLCGAGWADVTHTQLGELIPKDKQTLRGVLVATADVELGFKLAARHRRPVMMFFCADW